MSSFSSSYSSLSSGEDSACSSSRAVDDEEIDALFELTDDGEEEDGEYSSSDDDEQYTVEEEEQIRRDRRERAQVQEWLDEVNRELEKCLAELNENTIKGGSPWYRRETILFYKRAMSIANRITKIIDTAMDIEQVRLSPDILSKIYFYFYGLMIRHIKPMCESLPGKEDRISTAPIYFFFNTCCYIQVYLYEGGFLNAEMFERSADSSEYCREHNLFVVPDVPINNYNIEMLCTALRQLEMFWRTLPISKDIHQYTLALELCFAHYVCYTHDDNAHNVVQLRIDAGVAGEYYPTKELVFEMAVRFAALYEETGSTTELQKYVKEPKDLMYLLWPSNRDVQRVKLSLIAEAKKVHSDSYTDAVRKTRQKMAIYPSECYLFFKENPTVQELEPQKVFDTFRPDAAWRDLCDNYANVKPEDMFERCDDPLGVRAALPLLLEIICNQDLKRRWEDFTVMSPAFVQGDPAALVRSIIKTSETLPIYVTCMNDAYIVFNRECYYFGASCHNYMQALVYWINIIQYRRNGQVGSIPFRDFYITMMGGECHNEILQPPDTVVEFFDDDMEDGPDAMTNDISLITFLISKEEFFSSTRERRQQQESEPEDDEDEEKADEDDEDDSEDDSETNTSDICSTDLEDDDDDDEWGDIL